MERTRAIFKFFLFILVCSFLLPEISSAQSQLISVNTYSNVFDDGTINSYPVHPQNEFANSSEFVVLWVVVNKSPAAGILRWEIYSPDTQLVKNASLNITGNSRLTWAYHYERVSDLNISGIWSVKTTYSSDTQEIIFTNFTIKTPLRNTTGKATPNLTSRPPETSFYIVMFFIFAVLGLISLFSFWLIKKWLKKKPKILSGMDFSRNTHPLKTSLNGGPGMSGPSNPTFTTQGYPDTIDKLQGDR